MAKSTASRRSRASPAHDPLQDPHILFVPGPQRGAVGQRLPWHGHPYWQCERVNRGVLLLHHEQGEERLEDGMAVLIPPGVMHALSFPRATEYSTLKFSAPKVTATGVVQVFDPTEPGGEVAALLHRHALRGTLASQEGLLTALLACATNHVPPAYAPGLAGRIQRLVANSYQIRQRPVVGVADCARRLGYSPSRCSAAFHAATGQALKAWIDRQRADQAEALLRFSDESLAEIATALAFPDSYAFSRFFSRQRGVPPGRWRRRARAGS